MPNTDSYRLAPIKSIAIAILLLAALPLCSQTPPAAPIPAQLATAKSVFLANAGSTPANNQVAIEVYNAVYQGLAAGNRYHLTSTPADADLIFELSEISVFEGENSTGAEYIQIVIRDAKSQSLLWSTSEGIEIAFRGKTAVKNIAEAAAKITADLNALAIGTIPGDATSTTPLPTKTRLSDKK
jgi:hypothetical protein